MWFIYWFTNCFRETIWTLADENKQTGDSYETNSWKSATVNLAPSFEERKVSFEFWWIFVHHKIFTLEMFRICCKIIISFNFNFRNLVWLVIWFCMSNIRKSGGNNYWFLRRSLGLICLFMIYLSMILSQFCPKD